MFSSVKIILINKTCNSNKLVFITEIIFKDIQKSDSKLPQTEPGEANLRLPYKNTSSRRQSIMGMIIILMNVEWMCFAV